MDGGLRTRDDNDVARAPTRQPKGVRFRWIGSGLQRRRDELDQVVLVEVGGEGVADAAVAKEGDVVAALALEIDLLPGRFPTARGDERQVRRVEDEHRDPGAVRAVDEVGGVAIAQVREARTD